VRPSFVLRARLVSSLWLCSLLSVLACESSEDAAPPSGEDELARDAAVEEPPELDASVVAKRDAASARDARSSTQAAKDATSPSPVDKDSGASGPAAADAGMSSEGPATCPTAEEEKFSFFLISHKATQRESGSPDGFGGNLGGISGADAICQRVAEHSSPCQKSKVWRAFLSTTKEHAVDRIGKGPWHDRLGRLLAKSLSDLINERPLGADPLIVNDFPNEEGVPNHDPDGNGAVDNHQILTGSGVDGKLYTQTSGVDAGGFGAPTSCGAREVWTPEKATCWDWTSAEPQGCPRVGHSWPRRGSGLHWISVWNEGGCAPGGQLAERGGLDGTRRVGSAGGYGGFYCFAVTSP